jgi:hypothetical protein
MCVSVVVVDGGRRAAKICSGILLLFLFSALLPSLSFSILFFIKILIFKRAAQHSSHCAEKLHVLRALILRRAHAIIYVVTQFISTIPRPFS